MNTSCRRQQDTARPRRFLSCGRLGGIQLRSPSMGTTRTELGDNCTLMRWRLGRPSTVKRPCRSVLIETLVERHSLLMHLAADTPGHCGRDSSKTHASLPRGVFYGIVSGVVGFFHMECRNSSAGSEAWACVARFKQIVETWNFRAPSHGLVVIGQSFGSWALFAGASSPGSRRRD